MLPPHIFLTKAADQIAALKQPLEALGFIVIEMPCFEIQAIPLDLHLAKICHIQQDRWFFTSPNAVRFAKALGFNFTNKQFAAIGFATQSALVKENVPQHTIITAPEPYTSEAFLSLISSNYSGQRWALITGCGGRGILKPALQEKAISVDLFEVYMRHACQIDVHQINLCLEKDNTPQKHYCVITSEFAFNNLINSANVESIDLNCLNFLTSSERLLAILKRHGLHHVFLAKSALNSDIVSHFKNKISKNQIVK